MKNGIRIMKDGDMMGKVVAEGDWEKLCNWQIRNDFLEEVVFGNQDEWVEVKRNMGERKSECEKPYSNSLFLYIKKQILKSRSDIGMWHTQI